MIVIILKFIFWKIILFGITYKSLMIINNCNIKLIYFFLINNLNIIKYLKLKVCQQIEF
jgi:hypothetical protein